MSLEQFVIMSHGVKPEGLKRVTINPMDSVWRKRANLVVQPKQCFDNCFNLCVEHEVTYVLGICHIMIPIEHAWLKIDGKHYDPTLEIASGELSGSYHSLIEIKSTDLINYITEVNEEASTGLYAPMFSTMRHHRLLKDLFVSDRERGLFFNHCETI